MATTESSPNNSYRPTAIDVKRVVLFNQLAQQIDILPLVAEFHIYESIYRPFLTADITLIDSIGLPTVVPLTGDEKIAIVFKTPLFEEYQYLVFYVVKMINRVKQHEKTDAYTLQLASAEYLKNFRARVDQSYVGTTSDIAKLIYDQHLKTDLITPDFNLVKKNKKFDVTQSTGLQAFSPFNKTPTAALTTLAVYSKGCYMFYEDADGFNFKDTYSLIKQPPANRFYYAEFDMPEKAKHVKGSGITPRDVSQNIISMTNDHDFDAAENMVNGLFGQRVNAVDLLSKQFSTRTYNYFTDIDDTQTLSKFKVADTNSVMTDTKGNSVSHFIVSSLTDYKKHPYINSKLSQAEDQQTANPTRRHTTIDKRWAQLQKLDYLRAKIAIPGNSDVRVGTVVEVLVPSNSSYKQDQLVYDRKYGQEGKALFLVTEVTHHFNRLENRYVTHLTCVKDSFADEISRMRKGE